MKLSKKNHQGGLNAKTEETQDKRMYETALTTVQ